MFIIKNASTKLLMIVSIVINVGCAANLQTRVSPSTDKNEGHVFISSKDLIQISRDMAEGLLNEPKVGQANPPPKIAFISVTNNSSDYIDTNIFLRKIRALLIENAHNKILFLDRENMSQFQDETKLRAAEDSTGHSTSKFLGADYILTGTIDSIDRTWENKHSAYFLIAFRLVDPATSAIIWEKTSEVKRTDSKPIWER